MKKKLNRWQKGMCTLAALAVILAVGFMGIEKFSPKERSLNIVDEAAMTSKTVEVNENGKENNGGEKNNLAINAKAAVLIDGSSGKVLYAENETKKLPPASVTKVMTLLLVLEGCETGKINLDDTVTISERAASMGGSQMYMEPGEQHTVEELIKGVIMVSANDGCVALAEHLSGSVESFVAEMNEKAKRMKLQNSNFVNTNGLPVAKHYSCAYDIGMITKELMKYENARKWFTTWQEDIKVGLPGKETKFTLTNTNKMVRTFNGAIGGKTGFTQDAGYCLALGAHRDATLLIGVVLGCESSDIRFKEMARLLDYGFASYEAVVIADKGDVVKKIEIEKGDRTFINAITEEQVGLTVEKGKGKNVKEKIEIKKDLKLPVKKGECIGKIILLEEGNKAAEYELVSDRKAEPADFITTYIRMMKKLA